jgi:hypothetical protein
MYIPEYRRIQQDGKTIVSETSEHVLVSNFVKQMQDRGLTCFCAFIDKEKAQDNEEKINKIMRDNQKAGISPDSDEYVVEINQIDSPGMVDWSMDLSDEDMMELVMVYTAKMPKRMRLKFLSILSTMMMNEVIYSEPLYIDDDDIYEDELDDDDDDDDDGEFGDEDEDGETP